MLIILLGGVMLIILLGGVVLIILLGGGSVDHIVRWG